MHDPISARSTTGPVRLFHAAATSARRGASALALAAGIAGCSAGSGIGSLQPPTPTFGANAPPASLASPPSGVVAGAPAPAPSGAAAVAVAGPLASSGPIAIATGAMRDAAHTPAMSAAGAGTQVFYDDFHADAPGSAAARWAPADGTWSVCMPPGEGHEYCQTGSGGISEPQAPGQNAWRDYAIDAFVVPGRGTPARSGASILGRVVDLDRFYQLELRDDVAGSGRRFWYIWKHDGATWTELAGGPMTVQPAQYYHLRVEFSGDRIAAYAAPDFAATFVTLGSATDGSFPAGGVGLRAWNSSTARFDRFSVRLAASQPPAPAPTPSVAPTPAPAPASSVATYAGCPVFTAGDWYDGNVTAAPTVAGGTQAIADTNRASGGQTFVFSIGIERVNLATNATPTHAVAPQVSYHANEFAGTPFPWQNGFYTEGRVGGIGGSDNHGITINRDSCTLFETYATTWNGSTLGAYSGAHWDLRRPLPATFVPSAMASGLSLLAGAIKWDDDLATGTIRHALNFYVPQGANGPGFVAPATASGSYGSRGIPYGAHLRLHASYPETGTTQMIAVIRALKKYGMFLSDTSSPGGEVGLFTITPQDGNNGHYDFGGNSRFTLTDFDEIPPSVK